MGVEVIDEDEGIRIRPQLEDKLKAVHVKTLPHPGFPTDMQASCCSYDGCSRRINYGQTVFESFPTSRKCAAWAF